MCQFLLGSGRAGKRSGLGHLQLLPTHETSCTTYPGAMVACCRRVACDRPGAGELLERELGCWLLGRSGTCRSPFFMLMLLCYWEEMEGVLLGLEGRGRERGEERGRGVKKLLPSAQDCNCKAGTLILSTQLIRARRWACMGNSSC